MRRAKGSIKMPTETLTKREIEVMTLTATGKTRNEISQILSLSEETVKDYIVRACRKLNAVNKTHAAVLAVILGLITPYETRSPKKAGK
jgi:DNA-binding CsgD family transcriptional regulator